MLSIFRSQQPVAIAFFVLLFWVMKLPFLFHLSPQAVPEIHGYWMQSGLLLQGHSALSFFLAQLCLLAQAIWFNYLFHKADYHESNTILPAVYFTLVTSLVPVFNFLNVFHVVGFLLLLLFRELLRINSMESAKVESYNAGLIAGIVLLFLPQGILFIPFLLVMLYVLKPFRFNENLLLLLGAFTPLYVASGVNYLLGNPVRFSLFWTELFQPFYAEMDMLSILLLAQTGLYLLFSFVSLRGILFSVGFRRRKNVNMLIWFLLGMAAVTLGSGRLGIASAAVLWMPVSTLLALLLLRVKRKKLPDVLHAIFVLTIFIINILRIVR